MNRMRCSLLQKVLHDGSLTQALFPVRLNLLFHFLGLRVANVFAKDLQLLITFDYLVLEFPNLFLQRHD